MHRTIKITQQERRGAALVEAAICLPLMLLLVVGSIEMSNGIFQQHTVRATAHECARVAAAGNRTATHVKAIANEVLTARGLADFDIDIDVVQRSVADPTVRAADQTHFDIPAVGSPTGGLAAVPRGNLMRLRMVVTRPPGFTSIGFLDSQIHSQVYFVKER